MPWIWQFQKNPYKEVLFDRAKIPVDELDKRRIDGLMRNAGLHQSERNKLRDPNQRFVAEVLAHQPHKRNLASLEEYKKDFGKNPLDINDLITENLPAPENPLQTILLTQQHMDTILQPEVHFSFLSGIQQEDLRSEIALDT